MKTDETRAYLGHILDSIAKIERFIGSSSKEELFQDEMKTSAIIREFEVIGEAASQMPEKFKTDHPEVEWSLMIGMRNNLIHHYFGINEDLIWKTFVNDLPPLKERILRLK